MIIKIKSLRGRAVFRNLLTYILKSDEKISESHIIRHNLNGNSIEEWINEFLHNEAGRLHKRKNNILLTHEIISFHPDDAPQLSVEKLERIAREYIERRNPNGLFLGAIHQESNGGNIHIHFAVSAVEYATGRSLRMTKKQFQDLKKGVQRYQKEHFPELVHSLPSHGRPLQPQLSDREYWHKQHSKELTVKEKLHLVINLALDEADDLDDFLGKISSNGLEPYFRKGGPTGILWNGRKYRFRTLGVERLVPRKEREKIQSLRR